MDGAVTVRRFAISSTRKIPTTITVLVLSVLFASGVLTRWYYFHRTTVFTGDAIERYIPLAEHIASRGEFSTVQGVPDTFDQPLYPLFLSLFRGHLKVAVAVQMCLELAIIPVVWKITKALGGSPAIALCLLWAFPIFPRLFSLICTEALATLLAALLLWALVRGNWLWSGVLAGLCLLTRGDMILAIMLMFVAAVLAHRPSPKAVVLGVVCLVATILPWSIRTYRVAGTLNFVTGVSGQIHQPYVQWMDMWADNEFCIEQYWWLRPASFPEQLVPDAAERTQALQAAAGALRPAFLGADANAVFLRLTRQRRHEHPVRSLIGTRIQRPIVCWASVVPGSRRIVVLSAGGIALLALCVFALLRPKGPVLIAGALLLGRSLLPFLSILGSENRYLVEAMPACFALCSVALCRFWYPQSAPVMRPAERGAFYAAAPVPPGR